MNAGGWDEIEAIFAAAAAVSRDERSALLDRCCGARAGLREEVASLLRAHDAAAGFLEVREGEADIAPVATDVGACVGPFRLLERIGQGGTGSVFLAERTDDGVSRRVAVKLIHVSLRSPDALRAFRAERTILSALNHPHIVRLLDAGVTPSGQAFLAMERVEGVSITTYAAQQQVRLADRLRLFADVCRAVHYAHQHGIVHRDLKPANILVTGDGLPKVLDFGVAKILDAPDVEHTTTGVLRPLTPNYASPEQLRGLPATTACDVYALGVLLYELVTGVRPYETAGTTLDEMIDLVVHREPRRPSAVAVPDAAERRRPSGDLDAMVLKAMSKEPARRYASAQELSEDVGRHLAGRPVVAREPSFSYVVATLARRHRAAFVAATLSAAALLTALGVSVWQTRIAIAERNRAAQRFNDARQLATSVLFRIDDAVQPLAGSTPVRRMLVAEALTYLEKLSRDPSVDDSLRLELARGYHRIGDVQGLPSRPNLGNRDEARGSYRKAIALLEPLAATARRDALLELAGVHAALATTAANVAGANDEALSAGRTASKLAAALLARDRSDADALRLLASSEYALALASTGPDALGHWQRAGEVSDRLLADKPDDPERQRNVALVEKYLGSYYEDHDDPVRALPHVLKAQALDEKRLAADPSNRTAQFDTANDLGSVARAEWDLGHLAAAAEWYERSLAIRTRLAESDPNDVLARGRLAFGHSRLGRVYGQMGRIDAGLQHIREAVRIDEPLASLDSLHAELFAEDLHYLGRAEALAGHRGPACQDLTRSRRLMTGLASARPAASHEAIERADGELRLLAVDLAPCRGGGPPLSAASK